MSKKNIGIILLAAGASLRMGQSKQLLLVDGKPLLLRSVHAALDSNPAHVTVVLGARADEHKKVLQDLPLVVEINPEWEKGMGTSLKVGLKSLVQKFSTIDAALITVCDQPMISSHHLKTLIGHYERTGSRIVGSFYKETSGVPVLFDRSMFRELQMIGDNHGAKTILQKFQNQVANIGFSGGEIDLDTMDDYTTFSKAGGVKRGDANG